MEPSPQPISNAVSNWSVLRELLIVSFNNYAVIRFKIEGSFIKKFFSLMFFIHSLLRIELKYIEENFEAILFMVKLLR